jgi:MerR family mercuric resistance operon transcriptional regulator
MDGMTRSEVAERADVNPETLRYYERKELIPEPPRSSGGFRLYDESYVNRLRFIQRAQDLGFTLAEIKDLLDLRTGDEATCRDVKARADAKIDDLERIRDALRVLSHACAGGLGPTSDCPILDAMADENALNRALS